MKRSLREVVLLGSVALSGVLLLLFLFRGHTLVAPPPATDVARPHKSDAAIAAKESATDRSAAEQQAQVQMAADLLENLRRVLSRRDARPQEGLLTFKDEEAY